MPGDIEEFADKELLARLKDGTASPEEVARARDAESALEGEVELVPRATSSSHEDLIRSGMETTTSDFLDLKGKPLTPDALEAMETLGYTERGWVPDPSAEGPAMTFDATKAAADSQPEIPSLSGDITPMSTYTEPPTPRRPEIVRGGSRMSLGVSFAVAVILVGMVAVAILVAVATRGGPATPSAASNAAGGAFAAASASAAVTGPASASAPTAATQTCANPTRAGSTPPVDLTFSGALNGRATQNCGAQDSLHSGQEAPYYCRSVEARVTTPNDRSGGPDSSFARHRLQVIIEGRRYEVSLDGNSAQFQKFPFTVTLGGEARVLSTGSVVIFRPDDRIGERWEGQSGTLSFTASGGTVDAQLRSSRAGGAPLTLRGTWQGEPPCRSF